MELEFEWRGGSAIQNFVWREAGAQFDRWDNVATLYRSDTTGKWFVVFPWNFDELIPLRAYIYRQRWDDIDKAKKAVERKALPLIGVLQIQGNWV
jgi:hypothetical protein